MFPILFDKLYVLKREDPEKVFISLGNQLSYKNFSSCFFSGLQMIWTTVIAICDKHIFKSSSFSKTSVFVHKNGNLVLKGLNKG